MSKRALTSTIEFTFLSAFHVRILYEPLLDLQCFVISTSTILNIWLLVPESSALRP